MVTEPAAVDMTIGSTGPTRRQLLAAGTAAALLPLAACIAMPRYGVVVYGATPSGVMAALGAAEQGVTVALVTPYAHVGGIIANGLGSTDFGRHGEQMIGRWNVGSLFRRNAACYDDQRHVRAFEPKVAEQIFGRLLAAAGVDVHCGKRLASVSKSGTIIRSIAMSDGTVFAATSFVDASYEGDLMALALPASSWIVGRESAAQYGESSAGFNPFPLYREIDPRNAGGSLLRGINPYPPLATGAADRGVMASCFRACLTDRPANMAPIPKPGGPGSLPGSAYDESLFEINRRALMPVVGRAGFRPVATVDGKFDMNWDYVGASWTWPTASAAARAALYLEHYNQQAGWLWFVQNDPALAGTRIQEETRRYGLPKDEFTDNAFWPRELYVRAARRLIGRYVMTQHDVTTDVAKPDAIAQGTYSMDCHEVQRVAYATGFQYDSNSPGDDRRLTRLYQIPYRALLPKPADCTNLLVTWCISSSHMGFCSTRVEITGMNMGAAGGLAAGMSAATSTPLDALDITGGLQPALTALGHIWNYVPPS